MGKFYDHITPHHQAFIARQHIFFVAARHSAAKGMSISRPKDWIASASCRQTASFTWI